MAESNIITIDEVPRILSGRGWSPRTLDTRTWRCTVPLGGGSARFVVRHAGPWIYLSVMPFLDPDSVRPWGNGKYPARFLGRILAVNANLSMVKFALDDDGDLALRVELPTASLQARELDTALTLLFTTTEQYRAPIRDALLDAGRVAEQSGPYEARPSFPPDEDEGPSDEAAPAITVGDAPVDTGEAEAAATDTPPASSSA
ncbi:MAG: YbjN domain-containing protein [Polyangiales bacterium]